MAASPQTIVKFGETPTNRDLDAHYVPIAHNDVLESILTRSSIVKDCEQSG